ncbi:hypothetical protein KU6B_32720 [Mameliella alba]|nr:hypothetical protein KU6B_32720 [Mameliella alba]
MGAFVIGQMQIHSRDWMEAYFAKIPAVVAAHSGEFLVRGGAPEHLEGTIPCPTRPSSSPFRTVTMPGLSGIPTSSRSLPGCGAADRR